LTISAAVSWALAPSLTPLLSGALSGRTGLMSFVELPITVRVVIGFLLLDLTAYVLHRISHHVGWLWRLHQVHHSDTSMNASTHFRQHPITLVVTLAVQLPLLWLLGIPAVSWVIYGAFSTAVQLWHHSSVPTPAWLEFTLGWALVTPGLHRKHHNPDRAIHDHNYGSVLSWWDRLLGTHSAAVGNPQRSPSPTGLPYVSTQDSFSIGSCLLAPFQSIKELPKSTQRQSVQKHLRPPHDKKTTPSPHRKAS
jgi:sterol desaturase/sphingolipid hydroxylase (fatty acid hydroxylase superfamily)